MFRYYRNSDRLTGGSWAVGTGTPRTGYPVTALDDSDPSAPLWVTGTSLAVVRNFGSPQQVNEVYLFAHNLDNTANVHVQMHTADAWGAPDLDVAVTIPSAYADGFYPHVRVDLTTLYPTAANRTKQYLRVVNLGANLVTVAIGEIAMYAISARSLSSSAGLRPGMMAPRQRMTARVTSKKGVDTVYDYGTIDRQVSGELPCSAADFDDLVALEIDARGDARPIVIVPDDASTVSRFVEPMMARIVAPMTPTAYAFPNFVPVTIGLHEMGRGELLAA